MYFKSCVNHVLCILNMWLLTMYTNGKSTFKKIMYILLNSWVFFFLTCLFNYLHTFLKFLTFIYIYIYIYIYIHIHIRFHLHYYYYYYYLFNLLCWYGKYTIQLQPVSLTRHCRIVSLAGYAWCYPCTGYLFLHFQFCSSPRPTL